MKEACQLQACWHGTLVRRTLLAATLRAWVIQVWWNAPVEASAEAAAGPAEELDGRQEPAALRLQSWVRMCQCYQRYCQMCNIACILRAPESCFAFQNHEVLQARYESAVKHLGFHVKILSI